MFLILISKQKPYVLPLCEFRIPKICATAVTFKAIAVTLIRQSARGKGIIIESRRQLGGERRKNKMQESLNITALITLHWAAGGWHTHSNSFHNIVEPLWLVFFFTSRSVYKFLSRFKTVACRSFWFFIAPNLYIFCDLYDKWISRSPCRLFSSDLPFIVIHCGSYGSLSVCLTTFNRLTWTESINECELSRILLN